ncbi:unnamed protein product [Trifolium pratense]|uniref:Uncharacterized protein n=1 Tax=Trifolium pratense TaxID=57577 RepID=A0ACB0J2I8_TRIPR|nr:unnamed protein product [Trifolium pratense]
MDETTAVKRLSGNSLHSSSPPSTYIPLIQETILCRLPVKSLLRFRCICKPWDSLISKDLKFAKKHLHMSPKRQHLVTATWSVDQELTAMSCPFDYLNLHSIFYYKSTQLDYSPIISSSDKGLVASCDGILCFAIDERLAVLYNPCIRKEQKLPYIDDLPGEEGLTHYAFGYDPFIDNYKVVAVFWYKYDFVNYQTKANVYSYTLGTDSWKRIEDFPSMFYFSKFSRMSKHGIFMRGTVNWLTYSKLNGLECIVSLHLGLESYQEISLPGLPDLPYIVGDTKMLTLDVMRDCLCLFEVSQEMRSDAFIDVWLMKEYGNKESWIKLIRLPCFGYKLSYTFLTDVVYISEDFNHVLLVLIENGIFKWVVYDFKSDSISSKSSKIQDNLGRVKSKVYVESLISP